MRDVARCDWAGIDPLYVRYHDEEWGVPIHDDRRWFEFLVLEGVQAGLSWRTILGKREAYRKALHGFDPAKVARFGERDLNRLLNDPGLVRNRLKIGSMPINARAFLEAQREFGSFDAYVWPFVGGAPFVGHWTEQSEVPSSTAQSDALSRDLKRRGFKFVGSTIVYALMQAGGLVNDHLTRCHRYRELLAPKRR